MTKLRVRVHLAWRMLSPWLRPKFGMLFWGADEARIGAASI